MKIRNIILSAASSFLFMLAFVMPAAADGPNLVPNPSVEDVSFNPGLPISWVKSGFGTNTRVHTYPVAGHLGTRALKAEITSYADGDAKWYFQPVPVTGGKTYVFSNWYTSNINSTFKIQFLLKDGSYRYPPLNSLPKASTWTLARQTFTVPTDYGSPVVTATVSQSISAVGWLTTDDFSLKRLDLVSNGSVETASSDPGTPKDWYRGGFGTNTTLLTYPVAGHLGGKAVRTRIKTYKSGNAKWYFKPVAVVGGSTYEVSDWYTSNIPSNVSLQYALEDGTFRYDDLKNLPSAVEWTEVRNTFKVPTDFGSPVVSVTVLHSIKAVGALITDDFSIQLLDTQAPKISINAVSPQPVHDVISLSTDWSDNVGIADVRFFVGGKLAGTVTTAPFTLAWDTDPLDDWTHSVYAIARDAAMNSRTSATITVKTQNHTTAKLTVTASVVNDNGGVQTVTDFPLFVDSANVLSGKANVFESGDYDVSAIYDPGYTAKISGACDADGKVTLNLTALQCFITFNDVKPAPPITANNAIANPSLQTASSDPSLPLSWKKGGGGANTRVLSYPVAGYNSTKAIKTSITKYTSGDAKWYFNPVPVKSGQQLTYSDYYLSNTDSYLTGRYTLKNGTYNYPDFHVAMPATSTWKLVSHTFIVPTLPSPAVSLTIFHGIHDVGTLTIDAAVLAAFVPPPSDSANKIVNGSLEALSATSSNEPAYWGSTRSDGTTVIFRYPVPGRSSTRATWLNISEYTGGAGAKWYFDPVAVTPKADYEYVEWYKATANSVITAQFLLADGTYDYLDLKRLTPAADWTQARATFSAPANAVSVTVMHVMKAAGTLTTDDFSLKKLPSGKFDAGMISMNFDDGRMSVYENAVPKLNAAGLHSTQYMVTNYFNKGGYVDQAETALMKASGHEIAAHTRNHPHLSLLSPADMVSEVAGSKSDLIALNMYPSTLAYPFGDFNDAIQLAVKDAGYRGARSVLEGFNNKYSDQYALLDQHIGVNTTIAQVKAWIAQAKADKTWLILEFHDVENGGDAYSSTPAFLDQAIAAVKSSGLAVVNMSSGLTAMGH